MNNVTEGPQVFDEQSIEAFELQSRARVLVRTLVESGLFTLQSPSEPSDVSSNVGLLAYRFIRTERQAPILVAAFPKDFEAPYIIEVESQNEPDSPQSAFTSISLLHPEEQGVRKVIRKTKGVQYDFMFPNPTGLQVNEQKIACFLESGVTVGEAGYESPAFSIIFMGTRLSDLSGTDRIGSINVIPPAGKRAVL